MPLPSGANIDHLVIGPGGVLVLDTKVWTGVITSDDRGITVTPREQPFARRVVPASDEVKQRAVAAQVARALSEATGRSVPNPRAVVVIWAPFRQQWAEHNKVTYVSGDYLRDWLTSEAGRRRLHREQVDQLAAAATHDLLSRSTQRRAA